MRKRGKKFAAARAAAPADRTYAIEDAIPLVQKVKFAKFDETVDMSLRLGVDPKHADQMVRGTAVLPFGLGKSKRVLAIAGGEKQTEAQAPVGKTSFATDSLVANAHALVDSIVKAKPAAAKGKYLKSVTLSSTMGPGIRIDTTHIDVVVKH